MDLQEILASAQILPDLQTTSKERAVQEMLDHLVGANKLPTKLAHKAVKAILAREVEGSTGVGMGVGIPHDESDSYDNVVLAIAKSKTGISYEALDGEPVFVVFLVLAPKSQHAFYLETLGFIVRLTRNENHVRFLRDVEGEEATKNLLAEISKEHLVPQGT